jgi:hypothetical protein
MTRRTVDLRAGSCRGKKRFNSFGDANTAARRQRRTHRGEGALFGAYRCRYCQGFHVGERGGKRQRRPHLEVEFA